MTNPKQITPTTIAPAIVGFRFVTALASIDNDATFAANSTSQWELKGRGARARRGTGVRPPIAARQAERNGSPA